MKSEANDTVANLSYLSNYLEESRTRISQLETELANVVRTSFVLPFFLYSIQLYIQRQNRAKEETQDTVKVKKESGDVKKEEPNLVRRGYVFMRSFS